MISINKNKHVLLIILMLMIVTGFIIYFMYMRIEHFTSTAAATIASTTASSTIASTTAAATIASTTVANNTASSTIPSITNMPAATCPPVIPPVPNSIISRYFGVGYNIKPVPNQLNYYTIQYVPTLTSSTQTLGGVFIMTDDTNALSYEAQNDAYNRQWWKIIPIKNSKSKTYIVQPFKETTPPLALQYENGNLALRVYDNMNIYEGQKWLVSQQVMSTAIRTKDYMAASLFTPEFDMYPSKNNSGNGTTLDDKNKKQADDVINVVKTGILEYLKQMGTAQPTGPSASSLGQKAMPININLNLTESPSKVSSFSNISHFANVDGSVTDADVLSLLDKYNSNQTSTSDLFKQMATNKGCKTFNIGDYTSNRVSSCNCKIDLNY